MEDRDWLILQVLHKEKNITRTAELVYMSQPALTKRLQQIENEFGIEIVQRGKRGVRFTPRGEYLARCADDVLGMLAKINDNLDNMGDSIQGTLRIGASYFLTRHKLPDILMQFKQLYPKVEFKVTTGWSSDIFNLATNRDVHVAFIRGDYNWQDHRELLLQETLCIACAKPFALQDLPKLPRIDYKMDYKLKEMINHWWWENFSVSPEIFMEIDRSDTCRELVMKGLGYSIMPSLVLEDAQELYKVDIRDKNGAPITRSTWLFYHDDFLELKLVRAFVDFVKHFDL